MSNQPFECEVVAGARWALMSISETADLFHTISRVYREQSTKIKIEKKRSSESLTENASMMSEVKGKVPHCN